MPEVDDKTRERLGKLISGLLGGTIEIGMTMLPLLSAYKKARYDPEWREIGFQAWLLEDEAAAAMLVRVFEKVQEKLPKEARDNLIMALGGIPGDD